MLDHVSVPVGDLARSAAFYDRVLGVIGYVRLADRAATIGYGKRYPEFWLNHRPGVAPAQGDTGHHVALRASDEATVRAAYETALAEGATCDGAPGPRRGQMGGYFGAFFRDLDGNRLEILTFPR